MNKSSVKKLIIFIIALLVIAVSAVVIVKSVDKAVKPDPKEVIAELQNSFNNKNPDEIVKCFEPELQNKYENIKALTNSILGFDVQDILEQIPAISSLHENSDIGSIEIIIDCEDIAYASDKNSASAVCTVSLKSDQTKKENLDIPLTKIDGKWYISSDFIKNIV